VVLEQELRQVDKVGEMHLKSQNPGGNAGGCDDCCVRREECQTKILVNKRRLETCTTLISKKLEEYKHSAREDQKQHKILHQNHLRGPHQHPLNLKKDGTTRDPAAREGGREGTSGLGGMKSGCSCSSRGRKRTLKKTRSRKRDPVRDGKKGSDWARSSGGGEGRTVKREGFQNGEIWR